MNRMVAIPKVILQGRNSKKFYTNVPSDQMIQSRSILSRPNCLTVFGNGSNRYLFAGSAEGDAQLYKIVQLNHSASTSDSKTYLSSPKKKSRFHNDEMDELDFLTEDVEESTSPEIKQESSTSVFEFEHTDEWAPIGLHLHDLVYAITPIHDMIIGTTPSIVSPIPYLNPAVQRSPSYYHPKNDVIYQESLENSKWGLDLVMCTGGKTLNGKASLSGVGS